MQFDTTSLKLPQNILDAPIDGRMLRTIASHKFLDNGPERRWRQLGVWNTHRNCLLDVAQKNRMLKSNIGRNQLHGSVISISLSVARIAESRARMSRSKRCPMLPMRKQSALDTLPG